MCWRTSCSRTYLRHLLCSGTRRLPPGWMRSSCLQTNGQNPTWSAFLIPYALTGRKHLGGILPHPGRIQNLQFTVQYPPNFNNFKIRRWQEWSAVSLVWPIMFRIHAQRTDRNDRLCSLLSATLLRSARPQFSRAVLEKSSRRPRRRSRDFKGGSYPAIMFVHQQESSSKNLGFRNILEQIADDYGAFIIDVTLTNYPLNDIR